MPSDGSALNEAASPAPGRAEAGEVPAGDRSRYAATEGRQFASDNWAGMAPEALAALIEANGAGHAPAYGDDAWTERACNAVRRVLEAPEAEIFFVFNGTAANALALAQLCRPHDAVVCTPHAHVNADECNALGLLGSGVSLLLADDPHDGGRLTPASLAGAARRRSDLHAPRARAVTLAQSTELGGVYTPDELRALTATARELGLAVHMDGARFANAVAALGCAPADITWRAGIDVLSFGGTKNGLAIGEAVVFFDRALAEGFAWRAKQAGQLASKMRSVTAPWLAMLDGGAWLAHARHANAMAARLSAAVARLHGARLHAEAEANGVFAWLPRAAIAALQARGWRFHEFLPPQHGLGCCRFMCAWDSTPAGVDALAADIAAACARATDAAAPSEPSA